MHIFVARRQRSVPWNAPSTTRAAHGPLIAHEDDEMTNVFAVVGEHRDDPDHLLVLGDDGSYYDYAVTTGQAALVEPDQTWTTDFSVPEIEATLGV